MRAWTSRAEAFARRLPREGDVDGRAREIVRRLGREGFTKCVQSPVSLAALCAIRDGLAYESPLADAMFAMQGLGSYPVTLGGPAGLRKRIVSRVVRGDAMAAFALTEPEAGSDAASIRTTARRRGKAWVLDGTKTFISNAGIADVYVIFARSGRDAISAFVVEDEQLPPGTVTRQQLISPHPIGTLNLKGVEVPAEQMVGGAGQGYDLAMRTLGVFRATVGAAACGMARRALDEAVKHAKRRQQFGKPLAKFQAIRFMIADMATELAAARGLVKAAAEAHDKRGEPDAAASSMAKLYATEAAQRIVDGAVQIHGGSGLLKGAVVEELYREVRALRIYEGSSEIQRLVISREVLR